MIQIKPEIYRELALKVLNNLSMTDVCDEAFYWETPEFAVDAPIYLRVYRQRWSADDAPITGVGIVWAEVRTTTEDGEQPNDFNLDEFKRYIIAA